MDSPIIERLRKLIAHEKSSRSIGNLQEAEAFASRIQDLLTAHKLSMSEIEFEEREAAEPIDWERVDASDVDTHAKRFTVAWKVQIATAIGKVNSCAVVRNAGTSGKSFSFVGRTSDRELAKILYIYLAELGDELCYKAAREAKAVQTLKFNVAKGIADYSVPTWAKTAFAAWMKTYRESWLTGFGEAIRKRLLDQYEDTLKAQAQVSSNAIVHINKDLQAVSDFLRGKTEKPRGYFTINKGNADGYQRGRETGSAVNLSPNRFQGATGRASRLLGA